LRNSDARSRFWGFEEIRTKQRRFWVCEKESERKKHWFWLFQKPQRTAGFHERTGKEVMVCGQLFDFVKE
jgi:hypothetical protein